MLLTTPTAPLDTSRRRLTAGLVGTLLASVLGVAGAAAPAHASGAAVGGSGNEFHVSNDYSGRTHTSFQYGPSNADVFVADTDGDSKSTLLLRSGNTFYVRNSLGEGNASSTFRYGRAGDAVLVGDWDGDGVETLAIRRGNLYYVSNKPQSGVADAVVAYGRPSDAVLVGDWNGDGVDTLAVRRGNQYFLSNTLRSSTADKVVAFGTASDVILTGSWNGKTTGLAVRRGSTYYLKKTLTSGVADATVRFGSASDTTLVGDWDGNGTDTFGVRRNQVTYASQLVAEVNRERAARGLRALGLNTCASGAASRWASHLATTGSFYHQDLYSVLDGCQVHAAAENIARTSGSPQEMVRMWMDSPGHRQNILDPALKAIGSSAVKGSTGSWTGVHVFVG